MPSGRFLKLNPGILDFYNVAYLEQPFLVHKDLYNELARNPFIG
jgi:hypothetical protein